MVRDSPRLAAVPPEVAATRGLTMAPATSAGFLVTQAPKHSVGSQKISNCCGQCHITMTHNKQIPQPLPPFSLHEDGSVTAWNNIIQACNIHSWCMPAGNNHQANNPACLLGCEFSPASGMAERAPGMCCAMRERQKGCAVVLGITSVASVLTACKACVQFRLPKPIAEGYRPFSPISESAGVIVASLTGSRMSSASVW